MTDYLAHLIDRSHGAAIAVTEWPEPSTDDLDLTALPSRLDDGMLARVDRIAKSPLPALATADSRHMGQSLRMMLAVLPRRQSDDVAGELFVAAYERALSHLYRLQMDFVRDEAIKRCRWFPTVAECLEIAGEWRRRDEAAMRKIEAQTIASRERSARSQDAWLERGRQLCRAEIDRMTPEIIAIGIRSGALVRDDDGSVKYAE